ncbi:MAG: hypothetical protein WEA99_03010 [Brumimicrobium sp.]
MKKIYSYLLPLFFLASCGAGKVAIENTQQVIFEYDESRPLNYGDTLAVSFYNVSLEGERTDVSRSIQLKIYGEGLYYDRKEQLLFIEKRPEVKDIEALNFQSVLRGKEDSVTFNQTLKLNFTGPLNLDLSGESGNKGYNRMSRLRPAILSRGKTGKDGHDGLDGEDAKPAKVHLWKSGEMYYARAELLGTDSVWIYQTTNKDSILINNSGGDGGDGGNGGDGSRGKKGKIGDDYEREPGIGGDGGNGGNGGDGGNGAAIEVIVHPNAQEVMTALSVINSGGKGGDAGEGGDAGKAGKPAVGQEDSVDGEEGSQGKNGNSGKAGSIPNVRVEKFEFKNW